MTYACEALQRLAANVRHHRRRACMTQAALAEHIGVEPRFVRAIEGGHQPPSFKTLVALAHALAVDVKDLFEPTCAPSRSRGRSRPGAAKIA